MKSSCSFALLLLMLGACTTTPERSVQPLSGTSWQLVAIESMDDAQGTTKIAGPQRYTLSFGADGRAAFRIDCNRGTGMAGRHLAIAAPARRLPAIPAH
jgi:heat shock protein HslJ